MSTGGPGGRVSALEPEMGAPCGEVTTGSLEGTSTLANNEVQLYGKTLGIFNV